MDDATLGSIFARFGIRQDQRDAVLADYRNAREAFEEFAAIDAPHLPLRSSDALQVELARWQVRNFGPANALHLALGVCEEVGELMSASTDAERDDAIGDVAVYACQLATLHRLAWGKVITSHWEQAPAASVAAGRLAHVTLKAAQGIRGLDDPEAARFATFLALADVARSLGFWSVDGRQGVWTLFLWVAGKVMARDWVASPTTGARS